MRFFNLGHSRLGLYTSHRHCLLATHRRRHPECGGQVVNDDEEFMIFQSGYSSKRGSVEHSFIKGQLPELLNVFHLKPAVYR